MKNSQQEYADYVIRQHLRKDMCYHSATVDAIIDVNNTLDALVQVMPCESEFYKYHFEVLTILKSKL